MNDEKLARANGLKKEISELTFLIETLTTPVCNGEGLHFAKHRSNDEGGGKDYIPIGGDIFGELQKTMISVCETKIQKLIKEFTDL